jgi:hypothetical protein
MCPLLEHNYSALIIQIQLVDNAYSTHKLNTRPYAYSTLTTEWVYINLKKHEITTNGKFWQRLLRCVWHMAGQQLISYLHEKRRIREAEKKELQLPHENYTLYSYWGILKHGVQV